MMAKWHGASHPGGWKSAKVLQQHPVYNRRYRDFRVALAKGLLYSYHCESQAPKTNLTLIIRFY
jgi:hypothetical protein